MSIPTPKFTLFDLARVRGGRITPTHTNACPALTQAAACTCDTLTYRLVTVRKARAAR